MRTVNLLVVHGPSLNLLGEREPGIYGTMTLAGLNARIRAAARRLGTRVRIAQFNGEGEIIDALHRARRWADGIVINPGAYTHYSYALRDAIAAVDLPCAEVHLSDIRKREPWRRKSVVAPVCVARFMGLGAGSYLRGMEDIVSRVRKEKG